MTGSKCKSCGSSNLDVDPSRGDTVCTNCGTVLEDSVIVSELQFEENARGVSSTIGQFVSSESTGGCRGFGHSFHSGAIKVSRDVTLQNAKRGIVTLAQQLRLNQHCIDTAFNFYKMALTRHLTRGRKNSHVLAACMYITCRIEGTPHLLIDFSDVLQICAFELGRTYLKLSQSLCINVPSIDPCLYVLRFANKLEFGQKTHEVTMTSLRLVQRMKRDSMHSGRRPSGICGAALLMAARLHGFNRTVGDIIKVVQVHETTLRKRLVEFGETPSSSLTLQEFMTVDLEEEQDPPSYKAARAKDRERLKMLEGENEKQLSELQCQIESQLFEKKKRKLSTDLSDDEEESEDADTFIVESTLGIVEDYLQDNVEKKDLSPVLGPSLQSMGLDIVDGNHPSVAKFVAPDNGELDIEGIDDNEIDSYLMNETEAQNKDQLWHNLNAAYLQEKKEKEERLQKEREEGKPEKKKRRVNSKKKQAANPNSAGEAIEKMLQEKKISTKINYDVLKSLNIAFSSDSEVKFEEIDQIPKLEPKEEVIIKQDDVSEEIIVKEVKQKKPPEPKKESKPDIKAPPVVEIVDEPYSQPKQWEKPEIQDDGDDYDEAEEEEEVQSIGQMMNQHRNDDDYDGYGYDDDDY